MYTRSAPYYDAVYATLKDYAREAEQVRALIARYGRASGRGLLDVACGTGGHIGMLQPHFDVEGVDIDPSMLAIARRKHPAVRFHEADMVAFDLGREFAAVVCLFSAIAHVGTVPRLRAAVRTLARHTAPGGVVMVEPFVPPEGFRDRHVSAVFVDEPELKIARMNVTRREGALAVLDFHFLVATPDGTESFTERHDLALFTHGDYLDACRAAGLETTHDFEGLMGRGLYIGVRRGA